MWYQSPRPPEAPSSGAPIINRRSRMSEIYAICPDPPAINLRIDLVHELEHRFPTFWAGIVLKDTVLEHCPIRILQNSYVVNISDISDLESARQYLESALAAVPVSLFI